MRRALVLALAALALAAPAEASTLVYFCQFDICAAEPDGSKQRNLTRNLPGDYSSPQLSADGRVMVFVRDGDLYVSDRNARHQRRLPPPEPNYAHSAAAGPVLSRDGKEVLFVNGNSFLGTTHICRVKTARGSRPRCGTDGNHGRTAFTWGPKGTIVSTSESTGRDICVTSLDGRCGKVLVRLQGQKSFYLEPALSPDGRFFAATVQWPDNLRIRLFDARTGRYVRELSGPAGGVKPVWSPSGRSVAFERNVPDSGPDSVSALCTVGVNGGKVRCPIRVVWRGGPSQTGASWGG